MRMTLAQRLWNMVVVMTPRPKNAAEVDILLSRLPRNRAEANRLQATNGRLARVGGSGARSPLLSLHRRIERNRARQKDRLLSGRHV